MEYASTWQILPDVADRILEFRTNLDRQTNNALHVISEACWWKHCCWMVETERKYSVILETGVSQTRNLNGLKFFFFFFPIWSSSISFIVKYIIWRRRKWTNRKCSLKSKALVHICSVLGSSFFFYIDALTIQTFVLNWAPTQVNGPETKMEKSRNPLTWHGGYYHF